MNNPLPIPLASETSPDGARPLGRLTKRRLRFARTRIEERDTCGTRRITLHWRATRPVRAHIARAESHRLAAAVEELGAHTWTVFLTDVERSARGDEALGAGVAVITHDNSDEECARVLAALEIVAQSRGSVPERAVR